MKADLSRVSKPVETSGKGLSTTGGSRKPSSKMGLASKVQTKLASDSKTTPLSVTPGTSLVVASVMRTDCPAVTIEQSMNPAVHFWSRIINCFQEETSLSRLEDKLSE